MMNACMTWGVIESLKKTDCGDFGGIREESEGNSEETSGERRTDGMAHVTRCVYVNAKIESRIGMARRIFGSWVGVQ